MKKFVSILILVLLLVPATAWAAGGNGSGGGQGNGSGGGQGQALTVESCSVDAGGVVAPEDGITLVFSKNVVNASVADTNKTLFSVQDASGNEMAIDVVLADDQVEPGKKNDVVIQFPDGLAEGDYTLTAKSGITAKSGDVLTEDYTLDFTVGETAAAVEPAEETPDTSVVEDAAPAETESESGFPVAAIAVVVIIVVVGAVVFIRQRK